MGWIEAMFEQIGRGAEFVALLLVTGSQYIIDFFHMWLGMGAYAEFAPPAWMLIFLIIVMGVGYRAIEDINSWVDNGTDLLRQIAENTRERRKSK